MPAVTMMPSGKTIEAAEGISILRAILDSGENIPHKCEGKAECGSCHIFVTEGRKVFPRFSVPKMKNSIPLLGSVPNLGSPVRPYWAVKISPSKFQVSCRRMTPWKTS